MDDGGEGEGEEMKREGEREKRRGEGGEKEEVDGLVVPGIRRHRRSPRRERKRKVCSFVIKQKHSPHHSSCSLSELSVESSVILPVVYPSVSQ